MAFVNERKEDGNWRTIDRERNIILEETGSSYPGDPTEFTLTIDNIKTRFTAFYGLENLSSHSIKVEWRVHETFFPDNFSKEEIHQIIHEALDAYGFASRRNNIEILIVSFV